jgi:CRISPR-associated endonuclease/helicase Cas3
MIGMSVYTDFLSHPKENGISLKDHLCSVAKCAASLISETKFSQETAFYAGLLHDIGKLNPFYQEVFHADVNCRESRKNLEKELEQKYERQHSLFSAWAANFLLEEIVDKPTRYLVMAIIAGHHSELKKRINSELKEGIESNNKRAKSQIAIGEAIDKFKDAVSSSDCEFNRLNWEACEEKFRRKISFQNELNEGEDGIFSFLEANIIFSAVLQADRGSFSKWSAPNYDLQLDTLKLVNDNSRLAGLRQQFQQKVTEDYKHTDEIAVIQAPTGMGKTKVFLDLISRHGKLERVIYFSPLLALTEDFEEKVKQIAGDALDSVLTYNHLFAGTLSKKYEEGHQPDSDRWNFEVESFNKEFIITTTQRLLITLYSNTASDKLKLISFKNSLLILDEIQVIPKFILSNLIALLRKLCSTINCKVILVSATIPHEVKEAGLPIYSMSEDSYLKYHNITMKKIEFNESFSLPDAFNGKVLFMVNTRRKARKLFEKVQHKKNTYYLTTGIRKKDRSKLIREIKECGEDCLLVSTQVVEAGVDISFSEIYREVAPLDSIVQVMGRLSREGEISSPVLHVFLIDHDQNPTPYAEIEYQKSCEILKTIDNSRDLYERLDEYYEYISSRNNLEKGRANTLLGHINKMEFSEVWSKIKEHVFDEEDRPVLIPDTEEDIESIRDELLYSDKMPFKKYLGLVASLPGHKIRNELENLFDPELKERNVLLPRKGKLHELYDSRMGLDKWLT